MSSRRTMLLLAAIPAASCAGVPHPVAVAMEAAVARGMATASAAGPAVRCTRDRPLAFSCTEQIGPDHLTAVEVTAERVTGRSAGPRGRVAAGDTAFGPGGGGGRDRVFTADGAYRVSATEVQSLVAGKRRICPRPRGCCRRSSDQHLCLPARRYLQNSPKIAEVLRYHGAVVPRIQGAPGSGAGTRRRRSSSITGRWSRSAMVTV